MENLSKLQELSKVDHLNPTSVDEFHTGFAALSAEEKLVLYNHLMDRYEYHENPEDDDAQIQGFLRDPRFEVTIKEFYELINNETPENQLRLDQLWEQTATLEPTPAPEA